MTHLVFADGDLQLHFCAWEASMVGRRSFVAPAASILGALAAPGWSSEVLGLRSGLVVSGFRKLGVFTHFTGVRRLVSMRRGLPLLRVRTDRATTGFDEVLVSTLRADAVAASMRAQGAR